MSNKKLSNIDDTLFNNALSFAKKIFPYHKSITGEGIDLAFEDLKNEIDAKIFNYSNNTEILDWKVPDSWKCNKLSIKDVKNNVTLVSLDHPLRVASHSNSFKGELKGYELKENVALSNKVPTALSHQYIYYKSGWRISLTKDEYDQIDDSALYRINLDCEFYNGSLKVGEAIKEGASLTEILFLSHICHPAQFNDGLVGVMANVYLYKWLNKHYKNTTHTYKFLFMPETIGSHAYCSDHNNYKNASMALFTEMTALDAPLHVQMSENEKDMINIYLKLTDKKMKSNARFSKFLSVIRNDEKVFGSPGIDIPSASLTRALGREYDDHPYQNYHTSDDNFENAELVKLKETLLFLQTFIVIVDSDKIATRSFSGIPMLSKHGLFYDPSTHRDMYDLQEKLVWELKNPKSISKIAFDLQANFFDILDILNKWEEKGLVSFSPLNFKKGN